MALNAGDAYLDVHSRLAADFGRRLSSQVQTPAGRAGEDASRNFGRRFAAGLKTAGVVIGAGLAAATVVAARGLKAATDRASDLNETVNKTNVIFGRNAAEIQKWSRGSARDMGLSRQEALASASAFGDMFLQLKLGRGQAVDMSKRMVELASDFASFHNADITDVLQAQQSAFRGEYDALQRFVPGINAARVQQEALRLTHKKSSKDLTDAEKAQAAYNIMLKDGRRATGDFARTSKDNANQQRIARAQWLDLQAVLGKAFLPAQLAVTRVFTGKLLPAGIRFAKEMAPGVEKTATAIATALAGAVPPAGELAATARHLGDRLEELGPKIGPLVERLVDRFKELGPQLRATNVHTSDLTPTLTLAGAALRLVADHADLLVRHLPLLVAGFVAYKAIQAASQALDAAKVVLLPAQIYGNIALARSQRTLTLALRQGQGASIGAAAAQNASNTAGRAGILVAARARAATIAQAVASKVAAAASLVWRGAQAALNFVLAANPIGLVILAVAALVAGIIYAYKHSATFRKIVDGAFRAVAEAGKFMWYRVLLPVFGFLVRTWLTVAGTIVKGAATAFGWIPGIGPKVKAAAAQFEAFKDKVNTSLAGLKSRSITVKATFGFKTPPGVSMHSIVGAAGGRVYGPGTDTSDSIAARLSRGEFVIRAAAARAIGYDVLQGLNAMRFAGGGGVGIVAQTPPVSRLDRALDRFSGVIDRSMGRLATRFDRLFETAGVAGVAVPSSRNRSIVHAVFASMFGWGSAAQRAATDQLLMHESGYRNTAQNPTSSAYGMFQFLNSTWGGVGGSKTSDPRLQAIFGGRYIRGRYGSPIGAWSFWQGHHWYDQGGFLPPGLSLALNTTGRPERVLGADQPLLDARSARMLGRAVADELKAAGLGAVYLDSRRVEQVLAGARLSNARR